MATTKLNQIIAVVKGKKTKTQKEITEVYHNLQKPTLFDGINRVYVPLDEDGETIPPETKYVQYKAKDAIRDMRLALTDLLDATATQDTANCKAVADVQVEGKVVLSKVPVTHLLFLEKQLVDLHTFVSKLPTLDPAEKWTFSTDVDCFSSEKHRTNKTKKAMKNHVKAEATDKHPAQVETFTEDVKIGEWHVVNFSGAIPATEKNKYLEKVAKLQEAVKFAREEANSLDVTNVQVADPIFDFIFN
jgi:hypothetical protein